MHQQPAQLAAALPTEDLCSPQPSGNEAICSPGSRHVGPPRGRAHSRDSVSNQGSGTIEDGGIAMPAPAPSHHQLQRQPPAQPVPVDTDEPSLQAAHDSQRTAPAPGVAGMEINPVPQQVSTFHSDAS